MYFKRIEIQGFKSFADPVSIDLNDGITCIIGPNGSGKSNISDALRWVLGEQSSKQLRGSKMQDVIFAGTSTRKPKGMAEVVLVIDNSTGILPLEYSEVAITRRMYRSGESEYLINGNQCRLKEIKELFMDTGIGVDGYSIIGQGQIAEIVSTKPENRRQIFEEAAGVVLYKNRKHDAENKLKAASDNLERVRDIIAEIEGRIGGLKEESEKAEEYIVLREKYKKLGVNIILHNLDELETTVSEGRRELESMDVSIAALKTNIENLDEQIEEKRLNDASLNEELARANEELLANIEALNTISNSKQLNQERLGNIELELDRVKQNLAEQEEKLKSERASFDVLEVKDKELSELVKEASIKHAEAEEKLNDDNSKYRDVSSEIERAKNEILSINNKNVNKKADINTLENYKNTLANRIEAIKREFDGKDARDEELKLQLEEIEAKLSTKKTELENVKEEISIIDDKKLSVNSKILELTSKINSENDSLSRISSRKSTIEEMENNYEGYNNAVRAVMRRSFKGIIGTVSDLVSVPDGYELAIETALGAALQNIVCTDDSSAKEAVKWLKASKSGRATFLPLSSIRVERTTPGSDVQASNGYIGIAADIVTYDEKYKKIFDHLLSRVIIADNMDDAVMISKKKIYGFRIVTLDGEVISASGAITGGKYVNKSANLLDRKKEIEELDIKLKQLEVDIKAMKKERDSLNEGLRKDLAKQDKLKADFRGLEIEYNVLKTDRDHAYTLAEEAAGNAYRLKDEINTITADIRDADLMLKKHKESIEESNDILKSLEEELDTLIEEESKLKSIVDEDNESILSLKLTLTESETKLYAQNEMLERVRDDIQDIEDSIEEEKERQNELLKSRSLLSGSDEESKEKSAELLEKKNNLEEKIKELNASLERNRNEHDAAIKSQREGSSELTNLRDEKFKLDLKTAKSETLLDTQKDKLWDEFEVSYAEALDMRDPDFAIRTGNRESKNIKLRMAELGDVNISAIEEYKQVSKRYEFLNAQEEDTRKAMDELSDIISNMDKTIKKRFKETFDVVVENFEQSFKDLFGGGHAELSLEDESNPLESGIEITAQPPGKKLKNINLLSGGEKTLTAIALMFAVLKAKPTPFCILDEVEAALDEVNIERFSDYLRKFNDIQFALITHQKVTMEHADVLYGVTMPEQGVSRMLSLKLGANIDIPGIE